MVQAFLALTALSVGQSQPKITDLAFMAGSWTTQIWGGTFEETWNQPADGAMQGVGRLRAKGKTTFLEFMRLRPVLTANCGSGSSKANLEREKKSPRRFFCPA